MLGSEGSGYKNRRNGDRALILPADICCKFAQTLALCISSSCMPGDRSKPVYWPELDGLRAVAFLLVFFSHCPPPAVTPFLSLLNTYCSWGWVGVDLFFVLSGFLITYLLVKEKFSLGSISIINFYKRRALRIWPLYFSMLTGIALFPLFMHHWNGLYRIFLQTVIAPFFLFTGNYAMIWQFGAFQKFCEGWGLNFNLYVGLLLPLWSLCIEEQFYIFWPTLLNVSRTPRRIFTAIGILFVTSIAVRLFLVYDSIQHGYSHAYYYMNSFSHLDALMVGACVAVSEYLYSGWCKKVITALRGWLVAAVALVIFIAIPALAPTVYSKNLAIVPTMTVYALTFGTLLLLTKNWQPAKFVFNNALLRSIGRVSFAMYVFHLFILRALEIAIPCFSANPLVDWTLRVSLDLGVTWLAAQCSWHLLENRFLRLRVKFARVPSEAAELLTVELKSRQHNIPDKTLSLK